MLFVECVAERDEVTRSLDRRSAIPDEASDATAEVYEMQRGEFEALIETPAANHVVVNNSPGRGSLTGDIEAALARLLGLRSGSDD